MSLRGHRQTIHQALGRASTWSRGEQADLRLTWPIVIAAFNLMPHDPARLTALSLLSEFGQYACFDNGAACRVMTEFYQHEEVVGCMTPAEVTERLRSKPFLD